MENRKRVLIVDDSEAALVMYREILTGLDAQIDVARNGHEAFKTALAIQFDLVITDVNMPKMTGIELCRALQSTPGTRDVPIIIVSTFDSETDVEIGFEAGASAYIGKSDVGNSLLKTVSEVLWKHEHLSKRRILVVEDSKSIARFIEVGLMKHSYLVTVAGNGQIALEIMKEVRPDLILSDLKMPFLDGFALCKLLKSTLGYADIPFIAMSAAEEASAVQRIIQYGAAAYVQKPFSMNQLVPLIDRILSDYFKVILLDRARLDSERTALVRSISSLVAALEARDPYTKGHSESVANILTAMVILSGANKQDIELVSIGGKLHDIGKIGTRDDVLLKPGRLTEEEFAHIKEHPTTGRKILAEIPSLEKIIPIAYSHHERWDGKGYPLGLKSTDIPVWARMTSVADTFDALTSDRPYRLGMPLDKAFEIIRSGRETQLCPESVDVFFEYAGTDAFRNRYTDVPGINIHPVSAPR